MTSGKPQVRNAARASALSARSFSRLLMQRFCHERRTATSVRGRRRSSLTTVEKLRGVLGADRERIAGAAQPVQVRSLDGLAQEVHVAVDFHLIKAVAAEV